MWMLKKLWLPLQFYNRTSSVCFGGLLETDSRTSFPEGTSEYTTCSGLLDTSSSTWPESALFQIVANGVSEDKLVIGKPATTGDASSGYMSPSTLATCVEDAKNQGWGACL